MVTSKRKTSGKLAPQSRNPMQNEFEKLQVKYGLTDPTQIQMSIMWHHLKAITTNLYPDKESKNILANYDRDWNTCNQNITDNETASEDTN